MNKLMGSMAAVALGVSLVGGATGCKVNCTEDEQEQGGTCIAKSLKKFNGTADNKSVAYASGASVTVHGVYGDIKVGKSSTDKVEITFQPFAYVGYDEEQSAVDQMNKNLVLNVQEGNAIVVSADRNGGTNGLGCELTVNLPANFDGALSVDNDANGSINPGDVIVDWVGASTTVSLDNESGVSRCKLQGAATVTNTTVTCGDNVEVYGVSDNVNITTSSLHPGDDPAVILTMAGVSAGATGGSVTTHDGTIDATFPAGGAFSIEAWAKTQGTVNEGTPPADCAKQEASPGSKTFSCGSGGPVYKLTAGEDGLGDSNVNLTWK